MACCGVEVVWVSSNVRGTGIVNMRGAFKVGAVAVRGKGSGVAAGRGAYIRG